MTTKTVDSEANGASLSLLDNMPESAIYEYDQNNKLKKVTTADTIAAYSYLPDGRRASKTVNGVKTSHIWDGNNIVADTKNGILTKYIRSNKLEQAVTGDNIQNYTVDSRGDVIDFGNTDYFYDAFGNVQTETNPNPFGYCGEYFDQETGFIYLRNRYYNPTIGRFTQEDPIRDGSNWYAYCANNPTSFVDPLGLDCYIIYDINGISGDKIHSFRDEALIRQKQLKEQYNTSVYIIGVLNAKQFQTVWNKTVGYERNGKPVKIDEVVLIAHGSVDGKAGDGVAYLTFGKSRLAANSKAIVNKDTDLSVSDLEHKKIDDLYFSACNTAHASTYNMVYAFMQITTYKHITGWEGGTIFDYNTKTLNAAPKSPTLAHEMKRQHTWYKYVEKKWGIPVRERTGKREFWAP